MEASSIKSVVGVIKVHYLYHSSLGPLSPSCEADGLIELVRSLGLLLIHQFTFVENTSINK